MKTAIFTIVVSAIILCCSCSPKYYSPNTQNVPLITERGEVGLTVAGSGGQVEFQGAYGLTKNIAIQANGGWFVPGNEDNGNGGSGRFGEGGIGFYKALGGNFVFETYGLFGAGRMENHFPGTVEQYPGTTGKISANLVRYGLQPNFGWKTKYFTIAVSSRFVILDYNNINGNLIFNGVNEVDYLRDHQTHFLLEPALTLRGGIEKIKFQFQAGPSVNVTDSGFRQGDGYATFGLNFNLR